MSTVATKADKRGLNKLVKTMLRTDKEVGPAGDRGPWCQLKALGRANAMRIITIRWLILTIKIGQLKKKNKIKPPKDNTHHFDICFSRFPVYEYVTQSMY